MSEHVHDFVTACFDCGHTEGADVATAAQSALAAELLKVVGALYPRHGPNTEADRRYHDGIRDALAALRAKLAELGVSING